MVLTTQDANRTFLSYLGGRQELYFTEEIASAVAVSRLLIIEGYLWEMPGAAQAIYQVFPVAVSFWCGCLVTVGPVFALPAWTGLSITDCCRWFCV